MIYSAAINPRVSFLKRLELHRLTFRLIAVLGHRRQLFVLARHVARRAAS